MGKRIDVLPGERYGKLTIIREVEKRIGKRYFLCRCDCGNFVEERFVALRHGELKSCGCVRNTHHLLVGMREYSRLYPDTSKPYKNMVNRCYNHNSSDYPYYGGKGIIVCDEWKNGFLNFHNWAVSNGFKKGLTIDRISNDGNYEPDNCRWATTKQQNRNRTTSKLLEYNGVIHCMSEWAEILDFPYSKFSYWINKGLSIQQIISKEVS